MPRKKFLFKEDTPYHIVARTTNKESFPLHLDLVWEIYSDQLYFISKAYDVDIHSFVLMRNHFHLICRFKKDNVSLTLNRFMSETSRSINWYAGRLNQTYGQRNYKCLLDTYQYYLHAYKYVYRNPVTAGIVNHVEDYKYSTLRGILGYEKLVIPIVEDTLLFEQRTEETLQWLNLKPHQEDYESVKSALGRTQFSLGQIEASRKNHHLENQLL